VSEPAFFGLVETADTCFVHGADQSLTGGWSVETGEARF
jgi:hypothetical protein